MAICRYCGEEIKNQSPKLNQYCARCNTIIQAYKTDNQIERRFNELHQCIAALEAQLAAMTARAEKAESERVEVFDWIVMCDSGEVVMSFEESRDGVESMYHYLRSNHMIREAD